MDFKENLFGGIPWTIVIPMQLRQPKNVIEVTQVFLQYAGEPLLYTLPSMQSLLILDL